MSIIKILPDNLVNQIAAGEVVERPASVVKELIENSLDAGATSVEVEVKDGGKSFIKIFDDGKGMSKEDLELAVQRHATSKITDEKDLWKIKTMGFRGEALASISSVSKMTIKSAKEGDVSGYQLEIDGGDIKSISEAAMNRGTQIEIHDLFFNTPARKKYLKRDSTELSHITSVLNKVALANPGIALKLVHNNKVVFDFPKSSDLISRIADSFGSTTAEAMIPVFYGSSVFQIDGYIGKPLLSRSTAQHQYFFVNGRPIQNFLFAARIKDAYKTMLMEHKKPIFVINITIDPSLIDVNVHPRKIEVKFEDQQAMVKAVYGCVKVALEKANLIPKGFSESRNYTADRFPVAEPRSANSNSQGFNMGGNFSGSFGSGNSEQLDRVVRQTLVQDSFNLEDRTPAGIEEDRGGKIKSITQISNSYIVAENDEGLILIDQHAAHEKVRYEELMDQYENQEKSVQALLTPMNIEFSAEEIPLVEDSKEILKSLGFEIEPFGGNTYVIYAVPSCLVSEDIDDVIKGVLDDVKQGRMASNVQGKVEEVLTYMSCRTAIKFGQSLSLVEMQSLVEQLDTLKRPFTCPHGRPTMISLTLGELEKMFGRK
jgi:DNA mismatch repair protein MutL